MIVNKTELSKIIGKTNKTLTQWQKLDPPLPMLEKAAKKGESNKYETVEVIAWMTARNNKQLDYNEERTRLTKLQADYKDLEVKQTKGELLPVEVMTMIWKKIIVSAKNRILGIRSDVKMKNPKISVEVLDVIQAVCKEALNELSNSKLPDDIIRSMGKYAKNLESTTGPEVKRVGK